MSWKWIAGLALLAVAIGCSRGTKGLSVSTHAAVTPNTAKPAALVLANGITISRIRLVVREISVDGGDAVANGGACDREDEMPAPAAPASGMTAGSTADHGGEPGDCEVELEFGPFPVELSGDALNGAVAFAFDVPVPPGTYEEVKIEIGTIPVEKAGMDPILVAMANAQASVWIEGLVDAGTPGEKPFTFKAPLAVAQKREGEIHVGAGTNVTLDFDPRGWFTAPDGTRLDPTVEANAAQIAENVRTSIRLVKDDDEDGCDDDDGCAPAL